MTFLEETTVTTQRSAYPQSWIHLPEAGDRDWHALAERYDSISLSDMDGVALLDRLDTKFVLTTAQLWDVLANLRQDYWMLDVDGVRLNHYRTLYFDTPGFDLYQAHVNGRPERYKVRSREYSDSGLAFFEVKHRTRKDRTIKDRICTPEQVIALTPEIGGWLGEVAPIDGKNLEPKLWNSFFRMTLVNQQCCERVTLDLGLAFSTDTRHIALNGVAIAEVKMDRAYGAASGTSPFLGQMRSMRIASRGFSKYAMGVAMLYEGVKKNALKPRLLWVNKLMEGSRTNG